MNNAYILTLSCQDRPGIVHEISGILFNLSGNITEAAQYNDHETGLFFMRIRFNCDLHDKNHISSIIGALAQQKNMSAKIWAAHEKTDTVIFVSQQGHCLNDLLFRWKNNLLNINIRAIISNHLDFQHLAKSYDLPFYHTPISIKTKLEMEQQQLLIIKKYNAKLVVLARYMQILSSSLCQQLSGRAINIHHSFLPSFKGAKPYAQAYERGVKLIGATAHYVTEDLDEGPIIEQSVQRVDHSMSVSKLTATGQDTESHVLAKAIKWHCEHRILLNGHRTVVFR